MNKQAETFHKLHAPGELLILPNAWDAGSARIIESCGASAIATSSAAVAWALGYPDGNALPPATLARTIEAIVRVIDVPLTVDGEAGYSDDPVEAAANVAAFADAGARHQHRRWKRLARPSLRQDRGDQEARARSLHQCAGRRAAEEARVA